MALLQRTRILPNQRLDLPDFNNIEDFACADFKAIHKNVWTSQNFVFHGFNATGVGTNTLSIPVANGSFVLGANDGTLFIGASSLAPLATTSLSPSTTNYIELYVNQDTGGADSRAFWDATANSGQGAEFSQIVDTFIFLQSNLKISTSNFSGDVDKVKICEVDVNGSGIITAIRDARDLFWRLGRGNNPTFSYSWGSRTEPASTSFTGADKDVANFKNWADAVMDGLREIKGTTYWYQSPTVSIAGGFRNAALSILSGANSSARFSWSGTQFSITDDNGSPLNSDVLAYLRLFDLGINLQLTRQDSGNAISLSDGQVLWIQIPSPLADTVYDGVGATSTNYRVTARGSVPLDEHTYWLAFREGSNIYLRGLGELKAGESKQIDNDISTALQAFLGFNPETATNVPYTQFPNGDLPASFSTSSTLVTAISSITENVNFIDSLLHSNAYDEPLEVISTVPIDSNHIQGPISSGTNITLPLDSRNGNASEHYTVGKGLLEVFLNGDYLSLGSDWVEVGSVGSQSTQIQILVDLVIGDRLVFRADAIGGIVNTGGGSSSLQDAYLLGSTITVSSGNPVTVNGPSGQKLLVVNGDVNVTGVIDPKGITFSNESSNPFSGSDNGLWVDSSGNLIHTRPSETDINITQVVTGNGTSLASQPSLINQTGTLLAKGTPVRINNLGYLDIIDPSQEDQALACIGLVVSGIANTASGPVITNGLLTDIGGIGSFSYGDVLYLSKAGGVTNTKPSIGSGGFVSGDFVVRLGVVSRNITTPSNKDLIVNVQIVGQL